MEKWNRGTFVKKITRTGTLEVPIGDTHVTIPISRYEELVKAESERDVILRAYHAFSGSRLSDTIEAVLGPRPTEVTPHA